MRIDNYALITDGSMGADLESPAVFVGHIYGFAVQAVWTVGSPVGNIIVQGSCDKGRSDSDSSGVTNWDDISTQATGGAAGHKMFNLDAQHYKWVRLIYARTSATGTLNARINLKGI